MEDSRTGRQSTSSPADDGARTTVPPRRDDVAASGAPNDGAPGPWPPVPSGGVADDPTPTAQLTDAAGPAAGPDAPPDAPWPPPAPDTEGWSASEPGDAGWPVADTNPWSPFSEPAPAHGAGTDWPAFQPADGRPSTADWSQQPAGGDTGWPEPPDVDPFAGAGAGWPQFTGPAAASPPAGQPDARTGQPGGAPPAASTDLPYDHAQDGVFDQLALPPLPDSQPGSARNQGEPAGRSPDQGVAGAPAPGPNGYGPSAAQQPVLPPAAEGGGAPLPGAEGLAGSPQAGGMAAPGQGTPLPGPAGPAQGGVSNQAAGPPAGPAQPGGPQWPAAPQPAPDAFPPDGFAQQQWGAGPPAGQQWDAAQQYPTGQPPQAAQQPQYPMPGADHAPTADDFAQRRAARPSDPVATQGVRRAMRVGSFGLMKLGPGRKEQEQRHAVEMVRRNFGGLRQITVINPKGGAGKTVAVLMVAMMFGQKRGGYVLAWDNNETQGTLGMRAAQDFHNRTVRDLLRDLAHFRGPTGRVGDLSQYVRSQGEAMFDVLASDESATAGEMLTAQAFHDIREVVSRFYKLIVVDTGNNVRAANWQSAIDATDQLVVCMSARNDSAETAARALDHLEQTGRHDLVRRAVTVVSMPAHRKDLDLPAVQRHFSARTRAVLLAPYEKLLDSGEPIRYAGLTQSSRDAWLKIAAAVAEGL
ncbi:hypothetical protein Athai_65940 [Actinocatenispora thailandica]|uniref:Chromosome partitioning protein n=1 Tax=Actinocatenispora thailandica TaxID=227318 RepID=A0A7R7DWF1_9ACTN|nr:chromosome partitioning protein [Actinocatenispora thailandica]BCJ39091.1 hypothetical protein Athai_65940 [Actinocatenispora thailandica]